MGGPTASNFVPSAELATEYHADVGPLTNQFVAELVER
jgi:hypothetical protein